MKIERETRAYNERRYGKPWIARITISADGTKLDYAWGDWIGTPGDEGILILTLEVGDVYARGQKDHRGNRNGVDYYVLAADGTGTKLGDKAAAYKYLTAPRPGPETVEKQDAEPIYCEV